MQATIDQLVPGGQGIATLETGKKAFLWNALPGETVEFEITKQKSHYIEGTATNIINPSPHRIKPKDPCYLSTSPWQIMDYAYELEQKSLLVAECFRQQGIEISSDAGMTKSGDPRRAVLGGGRRGSTAGDLSTAGEEADRTQNTPSDEPDFGNITITNGQDFFYRNKMEYSLYWDNNTNQISLAFHQRATHKKIPITKSSLERPEIWREATRWVAQLNAEGAEARDYQSLMLRCNQQGEVSGGFLLKNHPHPTFPPLSDTILNKTYTYSVNGFFQINLPLYELALKSIRVACQNAEEILDLYAGVGTIGLSVTDNQPLTLIESNPSAYKELLANCSTKSATPILAKSEQSLDYITNKTTIILDPPRAGLDPQLTEKLLEQAPPTIIYLSCNPITQARDIKPLLTKYHLKSITPFNFFPRTPHIENLAILSKI